MTALTHPTTNNTHANSRFSTTPCILQDEEAITSTINAFRLEHQDTHGNTLIISPLQEDDVGPASVVLTRAFATSPQGIPFDDGRKYTRDMLRAPPHAALLVARLFPPATDAATANSGGGGETEQQQQQQQSEVPDWMPPNQDSRLIATGTLSLHPVARETFETLQPPHQHAYICNIAVDPKFRRQGYARRILAACEDLARECGHTEVYLHVRLADDAAQQLYMSSGYEEVAADAWLVKLRGITPRSLMRKSLF